ncbi:aldo/keto reductase [Streptomyces sp. NBC_00893]|uniref:aldo/keto reductase n=1 Tax=Streptomyces sp. NBC_00893 TaxID=2975862 RepID=UPI002258264C|nr:aldo/keto reductase [Streptomyces sp. NBC_00893]MCX4844132.1 aldo/keto reductase [Streptomyces sp. NBC_00893]
MSGQPMRSLGISDMKITRVGLGGAGWDACDDKQVIDTIRHAVDNGINWIDTAAVYGRGRSERLVAKALAALPESDRPYVFTKCGHIWDETGASTELRKVGTPSNIRREIDDSLRRLGVERIDLYQMHCPPEDGTPLTAYWETLLELKRTGKVNAVGLSNHGAGQLAEAEAIGHVDSLQPPFSAIRREVAHAEIPWCADHGTGVLAYSPMQAGLLSDGFTRARAEALGKDDWRSAVADFRGAKLERNLALAESLRPIARRHEVSVPSVAIAWTLSWPGVTGAIVGGRRTEQVDGWLSALRLELTAQDLTDMAAAMERTGAGTGPVHPG